MQSLILAERLPVQILYSGFGIYAKRGKKHKLCKMQHLISVKWERSQTNVHKSFRVSCKVGGSLKPLQVKKKTTQNQIKMRFGALFEQNFGKVS